MSELATLDAYGRLTEPATLTIQRLLPGPAERLWAYLTESDLRRQWLASGDMVLEPGAAFEFVWRNEELAGSTGHRPEGFPEEHRLRCEIIEADPPRRLSFVWGKGSRVSFDLEPRGAKVLLTLVHSRLPDRSTTLNVSAGWHAHLDVLAAISSGETPKPFWNNWIALKAEYDKRLPA